ncbi:hypothetical protein PSEUBRA_006212 [Kalmanozyma brasiliensis GHG001]|uniref:Uncharacterized protein n=1 Tax=Kalmanozyma brasiliensis (strain GHG001) TaxID=1365824 RepID=V5EII9_KALBG|nr:uncharacterized protein PSEUBRA_006212 [Kalmanozyma brasiliensis GHG001]EST04475.1 hypothetical protein PSEUBRA_006212 [Kalmanozyma brasiliensis GHG001]
MLEGEDRAQLIKDMQRGRSGQIPYDYSTTLAFYDARILLVFAGISSGPDSYCTGAVISKAGPLGKVEDFFKVFERLREQPEPHTLQRADDGQRCYIYLNTGFAHDNPVGLRPPALVEWFERQWHGQS